MYMYLMKVQVVRLSITLNGCVTLHLYPYILRIFLLVPILFCVAGYLQSTDKCSIYTVRTTFHVNLELST